MTDDKPFEPGEVVQLHSGGPPLTFAGYTAPHQSPKVGEPFPVRDTREARVRWFTEDGLLHEAKLESATLRRYPRKKKIENA